MATTNAAIAGYKKFGLPKSLLIWMMQNQKTIPQIYKDLFQSYFLLYWKGEYILNNNNNGTLRYHGRNYVIVYDQDCSRGHILANQQDQYSLSFRVAAEEYAAPNYVFISRAH